MDVVATENLLVDLRWLQRLAGALARDPDVAADAVQDTWARVLGERGAVAHPRAWLVAVLRNCVRRRRRDERRQTERQQAAARDEAVAPTVDLVQRAELQRRIVSAALSLPPHQRDVVLMRFFDGLPPRQIAARLSLSVDTVNSRLQRALASLRSALDREHGSRSAWLPVAIALPAGLSLLSVTGVLMEAKWKVVLGVFLAVSTATLFWPDASSGGAEPAAAAGRPPAHRGGSGGDGGGGGGGPTASGGSANARTRAETATDPAAEATVRMAGRVCDCAGTPLAGVPVRAGGAGGAVTQSRGDGRFEFELPRRRVGLTVDDERFVTVLGSAWEPDSTIEPVLVVAPALRVAGLVVDAAAQPVAGASLLVLLPDDFNARLPMRLDRADQLRWNARTAPDGTFGFHRVPRIDGASLLVTADAFRPETVPVPAEDDEHLQVVLQRFAWEAGQIDGVVVDAQGVPVPGARVAMGVTSVVTDDRGRFGLLLRRAGWPTAITAAKAGYLPARFEPPRSGGARREDWPEHLELRLGLEPQTIRGEVVDQDGRPVAGALVWVAEPTLLGIAGILPLYTEYVLAGGELPPQAARMRVPFADDPSREDMFLDQISHVPPPTASWYYTTTDEHGAFAVGGLLPQDYTLRALDKATGLLADSNEVPAGGHATIRVERAGLWPVVRGRVVSVRGTPMAGVEVEASVRVFHRNERVPGGRFAGSAMQPGASVRTGADGTFELRDVASRNVVLTASGDAVIPRSIDGAAITDPREVRIEVEARCHVEVVLADPAEADQVAARAADGEPIDIAVLRDNSFNALTELALHGGRSGVFQLGERAATLVLLRGGTVVREVPLRLEPGATFRVQ